MNPLHPWEDPRHAGNSSKWHTGETCITASCDAPAGTRWSPLWCQACNARRINRISASLASMQRLMDEALHQSYSEAAQEDKP